MLENFRLCTNGKAFHKSMDDINYKQNNFEEYPSYDDQESHLSRKLIL